MFRDRVLRHGGYRRFREERAVRPANLGELTDLVRICPSEASLEALRCILAADHEAECTSVSVPAMDGIFPSGWSRCCRSSR